VQEVRLAQRSAFISAGLRYGVAAMTAAARSRLRATLSALGNRRFRWLLLGLLLLPTGLQYLQVTFTSALSLVAQPWEDVWVHVRAAQALSHGGDPYAPLLKSGRLAVGGNAGYNYPPLLAWLWQPLLALSPRDQVLLEWLLLQVCLALGLWLTHRTLRSDRQLLALMVAVAIVSYWVRRDFLQGQISLVLLACEAAWLLLWTRGRDWLGGIPLAIGAALKVTPALLFALAAGRGRWRVVAGGAVAGALLVLASGPALWVEYVVKVLPFLPGSDGEIENQSPFGTLVRIFRPGALYLRDSIPMGNGYRAASLLLLIVLAGTTAVALARRVDTDRGRSLEGAAVIALLPLLMPVTWGHHLVTELIPIFVLANQALVTRRWRPAAAAAACWVLANPAHLAFWVWLNGTAWFPVTNLAVESSTVGIVLLWAACLVEFRREVALDPARDLPGPVPGLLPASPG
jgi:F0F1-type ATP synthase assembly protein I